ncbi:MAG: DUF5700 domain-containing putative Zn-dependent protease [Candidatus Heimdallarchaeaceae archaeon]
MSIEFSVETIPLMFKLLDKLKNNELKKKELLDLLSHPDYQVEFKRYKGRISKEEFIDFFLNYFKLEVDKITNPDLRIQYDFIRMYYEDPDKYKTYYTRLKNLSFDLIEKEYRRALKGLPSSVNINNIKMAITISIGRSGAWAYNNNIHFDLLKLVSVTTFEGFVANIAHEIHHVGFNQYCENIDFKNIDLESLFYFCFASEGLAVKYCNNASGILSKSIYSDEQENIGIDAESWHYLKEDFADTYQNFKTHISMIRSKAIIDQQELLQIVKDYWMNFHKKDQAETEVPKLRFCRLYSMGNEIWGLLHDTYGKERTFEILKNLHQFPEAYNEALKKIGRVDLLI